MIFYQMTKVLSLLFLFLFQENNRTFSKILIMI